jgi:hypothetical protein
MMPSQRTLCGMSTTANARSTSMALGLCGVWYSTKTNGGLISGVHWWVMIVVADARCSRVIVALRSAAVVEGILAVMIREVLVMLGTKGAAFYGVGLGWWDGTARTGERIVIVVDAVLGPARGVAEVVEILRDVRHCSGAYKICSSDVVVKRLSEDWGEWCGFQALYIK